VRQTMTNGSSRIYFSTMEPGVPTSYLKTGLYRDKNFTTPSVAWFDAWRIATTLHAATPGNTTTAPGNSTAGASRSKPGSHPAKLRVHRVVIRGRRLDMLAGVTRHADGQKVKVDVHAAGRHFSFSERIKRGRLHARRTLPRAQGRPRTAMVTLRYAGNDEVRASTVRLRAASRRS